VLETIVEHRHGATPRGGTPKGAVTPTIGEHRDRWRALSMPGQFIGVTADDNRGSLPAVGEPFRPPTCQRRFARAADPKVADDNRGQGARSTWKPTVEVGGAMEVESLAIERLQDTRPPRIRRQAMPRHRPGR